MRLSVGAGFVMVICGDVMTMLGLPKVPASQSIDVVDGQIIGFFKDRIEKKARASGLFLSLVTWSSKREILG